MTYNDLTKADTHKAIKHQKQTKFKEENYLQYSE